ncbi:MAG: hypothetical protein EZS28_001936, partial [Streblomastix strix]
RYYFPPEAFTQNKMTQLSDIWAMGVIIIEMFTGIHPFICQTEEETINKIKKCDIKPFPDYIDEQLKKVLLNMVDVDADKRKNASEILKMEFMQLQVSIENMNDAQSQNEKQQFISQFQQLEIKLNEAQERAKIAEERAKNEEKRRKEVEARLLQMGEGNNVSSSSVKNGQNDIESKSEDLTLVVQLNYQKIAEDLNKPLFGDERMKSQILQQQKDHCIKIAQKYDKREDNEGRLKLINSGIALSLINIFETQDLRTITQPISKAYFVITAPANEEVQQKLSKMNPFAGLVRILGHSDHQIVENSLGSLTNIILGGANSTPSAQYHPQYDEIIACNGISKIFEIFQRNESKFQKSRSAICIGEIDEFMRKDLISYFKFIICDPNDWIRNTVRIALRGLANNTVMNRREIFSNDLLKSITSNIRQPIEGSDERKNEIKLQCEGSCMILYALFYDGQDNEGR